MNRFNRVVKITGWIPDRETGLCQTDGVGAPNHQGPRASCRQRQFRLPLPKAVLSLVRTKLGRLPTLAAIDRCINTCDAAITTEGDAADKRLCSHLDLVAIMNVRNEGSRYIPGGRDEAEALVARLDRVVRNIGYTVRG